MLINLDTDLDRKAQTRRLVEPVGVDSKVTVTQVAPTSVSATHVMSSAWGWEETRDYVVGEIERRFGPFPRDAVKESGIFKGFVDRWGVQAQPIARAAFETFNGYWRSAPISVTRFCKGSDPYFAAVIAQNLSSVR